MSRFPHTHTKKRETLTVFGPSKDKNFVEFGPYYDEAKDRVTNYLWILSTFQAESGSLVAPYDTKKLCFLFLNGQVQILELLPSSCSKPFGIFVG